MFSLELSLIIHEFAFVYIVDQFIIVWSVLEPQGLYVLAVFAQGGEEGSLVSHCVLIILVRKDHISHILRHLK